MDAKRKAKAHEDLLHYDHEFKGGRTAGEDLRQGKTSGIKPSVLQMLFSGGVAKPAWQTSVGLFRGGPAKQVGTDDLRLGRHESVKPNTDRMLFRGGPAKAVATDDERMHHGDEDENLPHNMKMLADGGDVGDGFTATSEEKLAAHEAMHAMKSGDAMGFLKAMKGLFMLLESAEGSDGDE